MASNLNNSKPLLSLMAVLGLAITVVACTSSVEDDEICIGRRDKCAGKPIMVDPPLPRPTQLPEATASESVGS